VRTHAGGRIKSRWAILIAFIAAVLFGVGLRIGPMRPIYSQSIPVAASGGVTEIDLLPVPEGPPLSFKRVPTTAGGVFPLGLVERFIPDPLPAPRFQWLCNRGDDMVVTLGNGKQVTYGPCCRPASVNDLWAEMISASVRHGPAPAIVNGPSQSLRSWPTESPHLVRILRPSFRWSTSSGLGFVHAKRFASVTTTTM
jgi:hypothetical protein